MTSLAPSPGQPADIPEQMLEYLRILRAERIPHSGRTLLDHLSGTYRILRSWECAPAVCIAGLFHSIYGTNAFGLRRLDVADRPLVVRMIGEQAENLVYLFCISHRPDAFLEAAQSHILVSRQSGEHLRVTPAMCQALIEIESANLIEQDSAQRFLQRLHDWSKAHPGAGLRPALQVAAAEACRAAAGPSVVSHVMESGT